MTIAPVDLLVLVRLLVATEKGEAVDKLRKDLTPIVEDRWTGRDWSDRLDRALEGLEASGRVARVVDKKGKLTAKLTATDAGRRLALDAIGLDALPPKTTWARLKSPYLLAVALDRAGRGEADAKWLAGASGLKAAVLRERYGLPIGDRPTIKQASEALAASLFGLDPAEPFTTDAILRKLLVDAGLTIPRGQKPSLALIIEAILRRELGDPAAKKPLDLIVAKAVGARQSTGPELTMAAIRDWVKRAEPAGDRPPSPPQGLDVFALAVIEAARSSPTGWFGDTKVFISHVWRQIARDSRFEGLDLEAFKALLIEAQRARSIDLSRADLLGAMDPTDLRESATPYLNAVYHFVRVEDSPR